MKRFFCAIVACLTLVSCLQKGGVTLIPASDFDAVVDGKEVVMYVKPGDKVLMSKYAGTEVKVDSVEYTILRQNDILAIVE